MPIVHHTEIAHYFQFIGPLSLGRLTKTHFSSDPNFISAKKHLCGLFSRSSVRRFKASAGSELFKKLLTSFGATKNDIKRAFNTLNFITSAFKIGLKTCKYLVCFERQVECGQ